MTDASGGEFLISADSHVIEDGRLWADRLPTRFKQDAPIFERKIGDMFQAHDGGYNPLTRIEEAAVDGVVQEVLYPSFALELFGMKDVKLQEACFQVYNDWIVEYCSVAPDRLFGIAAISTYDIKHAVTELKRCHETGLRGATVWGVPPSDLSFASAHYDDLWEVAQGLGIPISIHILSGVAYPWPSDPTPRVSPAADGTTLVFSARGANNKVLHASNVLGDLITTAVFERFPNLRFVVAEYEASWIPFILSCWDKYQTRPWATANLTMTPTEYFDRNCYATFFNDPTFGRLVGPWGLANCMWSNDYPHPNSTWPESRKIIERDLGHLSEESRYRLIAGNVTELYSLPALVSVPR